jgi:hypothetical protein
MKKGQRRRSPRPPRRRRSSPRRTRVVLRPGQRLVTDTVIIMARMAGGTGVTTDVTCECTKSEPDKPDCQPVVTKSPGGGTVRVKCKMSGGCSKCKQTTTTTSGGIVMA